MSVVSALPLCLFAMATKPKTGEAAVKELARKDSNKKCFECGRGVGPHHTHDAHRGQPTPRHCTSTRTAAHRPSSPSLFAVRCALCVVRCVRQGPQATVDLTNNTFVCTQCSGLLSARSSAAHPTTPHRSARTSHRITDRRPARGCTVCCVVLCSRQFNHAVKTINMYTFKPAEVTALEEGGNKKAAKYWMHFYDAENPREYKWDMEDAKAVLEMMKLKYEAKKWCVEQPKKEELKKEKKKGKKKEKAGEDDDDEAPHSKGGDKEGEPSKEKVEHRRADSEALKLKEPAKAEKGEKAGRSRKSAGAAGGEGQPNKGAAAPAVGGLDFLSSLDNLSFNAPAAPAASGGGGFGSGGFGDDFGGGGDFGGGSFGGGGGGGGGAFGAPAAASGGFGGGGGFDAGFDSFGSSAPANGHATAFSAPAAASAPASGGGGGGGLAALVEQAQAVKVNPQAVSALVYQIKAIGGQYQLDQQHSQAMVLQAMGKLVAEPPAAAAAKGGKAPAAGGMDAFADLPLPADDGPGAEPDSGNPFGSDDDDDEPPQRAQQQPGGGGGGAFGQPSAFGQQGGGGGGGFPGQFGAPQGHFGAPQPAHGGFGGQQGGGGGAFGAPQQGGFGAFGAPAAGGFGAPQQMGGGGGFGQPQAGGFGQQGGGGGGGFGAAPAAKANNNALFDQFKAF